MPVIIEPIKSSEPRAPLEPTNAIDSSSPLVQFIENITTSNQTVSNIEHKPEWLMVNPYIERNCEKRIKNCILNLETTGRIGCYISGFSGNGKTTTAKKIVRDLQDRFQDIFYFIIPNSIPASLEEFIRYIIRQIEMNTEYEFNKKKPVLAFQEYIKQTKACIIMDNFEGDACSLFLEYIIQNRVETSFIFVSSSKLRSHMRIANSSQVYERIFEVNIGEFTVTEANKFIETKLSDNFTMASIEHAKRIIIQKRILNPYALLLTITYIINHISNEKINDIDKIDEMTVFFEDFDTGSMIEQTLHKIWSSISENAKVLLLLISFYESGVNINFLLENSHHSKGNYEQFAICLNSMHELISKNIISPTDEEKYSTNSLVKYALDFWLKQPNVNDYREKYVKARIIWVEICNLLVRYVGNCYGDIEKLKVLDNAGGFEFIKNVVRWCITPDYIYRDDEKKDLLKKVISIGNASSYYFYVRGDSANLRNSIEMFRYKAAFELDDKSEMFDALLTQLNVSSKRNHNRDSEWLYSEIVNMRYTPDEPDKLVKMKHAFALYHYSIKKYKEALVIWQDLYQKKDELIPKDVCTVTRWMSDCMLKITDPKFSYDEIMDVLKFSFEFASQKKYKRDVLQSYFKIVSLKLDYKYAVNEDEFFKKFDSAKEIGDESYIAFYYFLAYRILRLQNVNDKSRLEKARVAINEAEKHYRKIFDDAMCVRIARILSNPNLDDIDETEQPNEMDTLLAQLY